MGSDHRHHVVVVVHNDLTQVAHNDHNTNPGVVRIDRKDRVVYGTNHIHIPVGVIFLCSYHMEVVNHTTIVDDRMDFYIDLDHHTDPDDKDHVVDHNPYMILYHMDSIDGHFVSYVGNDLDDLSVGKNHHPFHHCTLLVVVDCRDVLSQSRFGVALALCALLRVSHIPYVSLTHNGRPSHDLQM